MGSNRPLRLEALEDRFMPTDLTGAGSTVTSGAFANGTIVSSGTNLIVTGTTGGSTTTDTSGMGSLIVPTGTPVTL
jgi:hypothetical protein